MKITTKCVKLILVMDSLALEWKKLKNNDNVLSGTNTFRHVGNLFGIRSCDIHNLWDLLCLVGSRAKTACCQTD